MLLRVLELLGLALTPTFDISTLNQHGGFIFPLIPVRATPPASRDHTLAAINLRGRDE